MTRSGWVADCLLMLFYFLTADVRPVSQPFGFDTADWTAARLRRQLCTGCHHLAETLLDVVQPIRFCYNKGASEMFG